MKYKCLYCGNVITCKWYTNKINLRCDQCSDLIFKIHEKKLKHLQNISTMLCSALSASSASLITYFSINLIDSILIGVSILAILLPSIYVAQQIICKDLRVHKIKTNMI